MKEPKPITPEQKVELQNIAATLSKKIKELAGEDTQVWFDSNQVWRSIDTLPVKEKD